MGAPYGRRLPYPSKALPHGGAFCCAVPSRFPAVAESIYGLHDAQTGELRYIGKACDPVKRLQGHMRECRRRNTPLYAWLRKHGTPSLTVIERDCADWRVSERRCIAKARAAGVRLLNIADGGDEPHCSIEVRRANAISATAKRP